MRAAPTIAILALLLPLSVVVGILVGAVPLIPLGLIGAWGARGVMDDATVAAAAGPVT